MQVYNNDAVANANANANAVAVDYIRYDEAHDVEEEEINHRRLFNIEFYKVCAEVLAEPDDDLEEDCDCDCDYDRNHNDVVKRAKVDDFDNVGTHLNIYGIGSSSSAEYNADYDSGSEFDNHYCDVSWDDFVKSANDFCMREQTILQSSKSDFKTNAVLPMYYTPSVERMQRFL